MSENAFTTIRITKTDKRRFRGYAKHPRQADSEVLKWILDKLNELDQEIVELNQKLERKKEDH